MQSPCSSHSAELPALLTRLTALVLVATMLSGMSAQLTGSALARSLEAAEKASLEKTVTDFSAAMAKQDFDRVVETLPPRLLSTMADGAKVDIAKLRAAIVDVMRKGLAVVKISSFGIDLAKAQHKELANGTPYVLVPTKTVIDMPDGSRLINSAHTVAIMDDSKWYLLSIEQPSQIVIFRQAYPDFVNVEFPASSTEVVKK